ncbi:MAG: anaerobic ribonucleoside-triphosphate reductase activating protein [Clostridiales bacterium]|nr:anaerobic ribonucleoside-triphosphate reductase activating protein [Clostridiales bacterium]
MNYANIKFNDIANGEGVRVSLFVSGCTHHCKNCFNKETWDFDYGSPFTSDVQEKIISALAPSHISGLTLLGGEPMEPANQKGLIDFVKTVKALYPNKTIWCYTGYLYDDELLKPSRAHCPWTRELLSYIDILVDGEFKEELKDITLRFKGSSNQRIIDVQASLLMDTVVLSPYNEKKSSKFRQII